MEKGLLFVVSAPSGCGKGTILKEILKDDKFYYSVSQTTRNPRNNEVDGINYHFITREQFEENIKNDAMLEYAQYCDNYYGTPKKPVDDNLNNGKHVILEIEVQGASKIRELRPDAKFIFIVPPSIQELERRLRKRNTENEEVIQKRINQAKEELPHSTDYDYVVVNGELHDAIADFKAIIRACELENRK